MLRFRRLPAEADVFTGHYYDCTPGQICRRRRIFQLACAGLATSAADADSPPFNVSIAAATLFATPRRRYAITPPDAAFAER